MSERGQSALLRWQLHSAQKVSRAAASPSALLAPAVSPGAAPPPTWLQLAAKEEPEETGHGSRSLGAPSPTCSSSEPGSHCSRWHGCRSSSLTAALTGATALRKPTPENGIPTQRPCSDTPEPWGQAQFAASPLPTTPHLASCSPRYRAVHRCDLM